jgi:hypothetical protein
VRDMAVRIRAESMARVRLRTMTTQALEGRGRWGELGVGLNGASRGGVDGIASACRVELRESTLASASWLASTPDVGCSAVLARPSRERESASQPHHPV